MSNNIPAFPRSADKIDDGTEGMSLRDYFAGQVLAGITANADIQIDQERLDVKERAAELCAVWCYSIADAMLKEREKYAGN